uniref:Uncharacterized protein n=1 Tax=Staphylococcus aureus TaxID=1280 RepID=Q8VVT8_STAAU|nr:unnamed protein product [Staphylococcus aureus]
MSWLLPLKIVKLKLKFRLIILLVLLNKFIPPNTLIIQKQKILLGILSMEL